MLSETFHILCFFQSSKYIIKLPRIINSVETDILVTENQVHEEEFIQSTGPILDLCWIVIPGTKRQKQKQKKQLF